MNYVEKAAASKAGNFFKGAKYSDKVLKATNSFHDFPKAIDDMVGKQGKVSPKVGGDGKLHYQLEAPGTINGKPGVFEYIKNPSTKEINRRYFNTNRK